MSNTIDEQQIVDGFGFTPDRLEQINWYVNVRGIGTIPAIRELINEGLLSILLAQQGADAVAGSRSAGL
jgi:hypothetical protein